MSDIDLARAQREAARWRILRILDSGRPMPVSEIIVLRALNDASLRLSPAELRRELDYLENRKLVELIGKDREPVWSAELTGLGVDVVEYTVDCKPGIARPPKFG